MRASVLLIAVASIVSVVACINPPRPGGPVSPPLSNSPVSLPYSGLRIEGPQQVADYGAPVEISLIYKNTSADPIMVNPFPSDLAIMRLLDMQPNEAIIRSFPTGTEERVIEAGGKATQNLTWDQRDENGQQVVPGWYRVTGSAFFTNQVSKASGSLGQPRTATILVLPQDGVLVGNITINQPVTANGITFTLQCIELTATGMNVYGFHTPSNQNFWPTAEAEYSVDGGPVKSAFRSGIPETSSVENATEHIWGKRSDISLDPISKGAKELTFRIVRLGYNDSGIIEGPWEFKIPLQ